MKQDLLIPKKIEVIPVGIGVNIGQLKPPLNLLQGFDITSVDSLNNFITVINRKFDLKFSEAFTDADYCAVFRAVTEPSNSFNISDIFSFAEYQLDFKGIKDVDSISYYDIDEYFSNIKNNLDFLNIQYASFKTGILVGGLQIRITGNLKDALESNRVHSLEINLSTHNFEKSFDLLKALITDSGIPDVWIYMKFHLNNNYGCLHDNASISSVISNNEDIFSYIKDNAGTYDYKEIFHFRIVNLNAWDPRKPALYVMGISFKTAEVDTDSFRNLLKDMLRCKLIYKIEESQSKLPS